MGKINSFAEDIMRLRYLHPGERTWEDIAARVTKNVLGAVKLPRSVAYDIEWAITNRKFIPGGRFLAQAGKPYHQVNNCYLLRAEDTREGWGDLMYKASTALMSGGGVGVDYSGLRPLGATLKRSGGTSSGPLPLMRTINEIGRGVMSGGKRRSALWAGLRWDHPDVMDFLTMKDWSDDIRRLKSENMDFPAAMDMTNISVILDKRFFDAYNYPYHAQHDIAKNVYWEAVYRMVTTGEPGFSVDYDNPNESLRNPCCEIVSEDDSDVCCLGSVNLANIDSLDELDTVTELGTVFLLAGTEYSDVPYEKVRQRREKNRRIGLGMLGFSEFLAKRGYRYAPNPELANWLKVWQDTSDSAARQWSHKLSMNEPIAKRAIAPNGTIGIVSGTTGGIEPIFASAFRRRYLTPQGWQQQDVIDPVALGLIEDGINPDSIEDAYTLSLDVERRIKFQAFVQKYVDNAISSTINLPAYGTPGNNDCRDFGDKLMKYLPGLRGVTAFPDGARGLQPLEKIDIREALQSKGYSVYSEEETCVGGVCGI